MSYFNFHANVKNLIKSGNCLEVTIFQEYHKIQPAMVFYFKNHKPIPIRFYRWQEYYPLIKQFNLIVNNYSNFTIM